MLSIESQTKSVYPAIVAPAPGFAIDRLGFWPVGALGVTIASIAIISFPLKKRPMPFRWGTLITFS